MNDIKLREEYLTLVNKAKQAAEAYYVTDKLTMSDEEYDEITEKIAYYEQEYGWVEGTTLITEVAAGTVEETADVIHKRPMVSLSKVNTETELQHFLNTIKATHPDTNFIAEPKLDGLAISVTYTNGKISQVATRGNGQKGEDITARIPKTIKGLPQTIDTNIPELEIRGEVYITEDDFKTASINRIQYEYENFITKNPSVKKQKIDEIYSIAVNDKQNSKVTVIEANGKKFTPSKHLFANSRNAVAGSLRRETQNYDVPMSFAAYDIHISDKSLDYTKQISLANKLGIVTASNLVKEISMSSTDIPETVRKFGELRSNLPYPTDGIVIKVDQQKIRNLLGAGSKDPKWATAYKYPSGSKTTTVQEIIPSIGRTGRLALRARISPTLLDGTMITYVSLHNAPWVIERDIRVGDTVMLKRANDVIPYIDSPDVSKRSPESEQWKPPTGCPKCGGEWDKTTLLWRCVNPTCGELNGIIFAAGRDYFDWEGLSEQYLTRLYETGLVKDIADVMNLSKQDLTNLVLSETPNKDGKLPILGETVATKIYNKIQASKQKPLSAVLAALGIRTLGRTFGRRLQSHYGSMSKILTTTKQELATIEGISDKKAAIIHEGIKEKQPLILKLAKAGVTMQAPETKTTNTEYVNKKIVITGSIPGYTRNQAQDLLNSLGAKPSSSVSTTTDILIADENSKTSSKYRKAESLGITIITPEEFLRAIK